MAKLFRVENARGEGMYFGENNVADEMQPFSYPDASMRHPKPYDDSALMADCAAKGLPHDWLEWGHYNYGFSSIEQLKMWVHRDSWRRGLHDYGFQVSIYEIDDQYFAAGDTQAIVLKDKPRTLIQQLSLLEI